MKNNLYILPVKWHDCQNNQVRIFFPNKVKYINNKFVDNRTFLESKTFLWGGNLMPKPKCDEWWSHW